MSRGDTIDGKSGFLYNIGGIDPHMPLLYVVSDVHTSGYMETTNHVIGIWQKEVLDVECDWSYPIYGDNLDFTCGIEFRFNEMTHGVALIPSRYSVDLAF